MKVSLAFQFPFMVLFAMAFTLASLGSAVAGVGLQIVLGLCLLVHAPVSRRESELCCEGDEEDELWGVED